MRFGSVGAALVVGMAACAWASPVDWENDGKPSAKKTPGESASTTGSSAVAISVLDTYTSFFTRVAEHIKGLPESSKAVIQDMADGPTLLTTGFENLQASKPIVASQEGNLEASLDKLVAASRAVSDSVIKQHDLFAPFANVIRANMGLAVSSVKALGTAIEAKAPANGKPAVEAAVNKINAQLADVMAAFKDVKVDRLVDDAAGQSVLQVLAVYSTFLGRINKDLAGLPGSTSDLLQIFQSDTLSKATADFKTAPRLTAADNAALVRQLNVFVQQGAATADQIVAKKGLFAAAGFARAIATGITGVQGALKKFSGELESKVDPSAVGAVRSAVKQSEGLFARVAAEYKQFLTRRVRRLEFSSGADTIARSLVSIQSALKNVQYSVVNFSSNPPRLLQDISTALAALSNGADRIAAEPVISALDAVNVQVAVVDITQTLRGAIEAGIGSRKVFDESGVSHVIADQVVQVRSKADLFIRTLGSKLPIYLRWVVDLNQHAILSLFDDLLGQFADVL